MELQAIRLIFLLSVITTTLFTPAGLRAQTETKPLGDVPFGEVTRVQKDEVHFFYINGWDPAHLGWYPENFEKRLKRQGFKNFHVYGDGNLGGSGRRKIVAKIKQVQDDRKKAGLSPAIIYVTGFSSGGNLAKEVLWEAKRQDITIDGAWINDASIEIKNVYNKDAQENKVPDNVKWALVTYQPGGFGGEPMTAVDPTKTCVQNVELTELKGKLLAHANMGKANDNPKNKQQQYIYAHTQYLFHSNILKDSMRENDQAIAKTAPNQGPDCTRPDSGETSNQGINKELAEQIARLKNGTQQMNGGRSEK